MIKVSFSWDDGATEDLKLAEMLMKYSIPSIFFIPALNQERPTLSHADIIALSTSGFEIGAHTYSHTYLTTIPLEKAKLEIIEGKDFLEQLLGKRIPHFCFPGGKYNPNIEKFTKNLFISARTADTGAIIDPGSFLVKPAFHFYNRGKKSIVYNSLRNSSPIFPLALREILSEDYFNYMSNIIVDLCRSEKDYNINIWGHSWEIEEFSLWKKLNEFLRFLSDAYPECISNYSDIVQHILSD
jgi:peptidoglycan/xylan/chitin deacetylase (PgdA/CDA1 family)